MDVIEEGIRRTTFPLPFGLDHVHCYSLRTENGWTLAPGAPFGDTAVILRAARGSGSAEGPPDLDVKNI